MYKTELHLHTSPVSRCARTEPEEAVEQYIENGYSTLVITNHISPALFTVYPEAKEWREIAQLYLEDYRRAKRHAGDRLTVLLGMELRVNANSNDYLLYGVEEQQVPEMGNVMDRTIRELSPVLREKWLLFQAHPFRDGMTIVNPKYLDGVEAGNFCKTHENRNGIAAAWAKQHGLLTVYGSDYHGKSFMCGAGILTEQKITDNEQLLRVLRSKQFIVTDGKKEFAPY